MASDCDGVDEAVAVSGCVVVDEAVAVSGCDGVDVWGSDVDVSKGSC